MKKSILTTAIVAVCGVVFAQSFTDVANLRGKTDVRKMGASLDSNFAMFEPSSASVTNGEEVVISSGSLVLTGIGGANDSTNTVTLGSVASTMVGMTVTLSVDGSSTNLIGIADSGTAKLSAAAVLDNNDTIVLYIADTNVFNEVSKSDN